MPGAVRDGCAPNIGGSFVYSFNLLDGTPFDPNEGEDSEDSEDNEIEGDNQDTNDDGSLGDDSKLTKEDRKEELKGRGLSPPVTTIFVKDGGPTSISGTEVLYEGDTENSHTHWYWAEYPE